MNTASFAFARLDGRFALKLTVAGLALASALPAHAQQTRAGVDVRASVEAQSNPYLEQGDSDVTATANGEIRPWLRFEDELSVVNFDGFAQVRQFADRYDTEDNYGANVSIYHRASERVMLTARAAASSTVSQPSALLGIPDPTGPGGIPLPTLPGPIDVGGDLTVLGSRVRTDSFNVGAGAQITLDARNQLSLDATFDDLSYNRIGAQDYRSHGGEARFTHVIDAATSIGAVAGYQLTDYKDLSGGDARTYNAMASVTHRIGAYWTLDASAGAAFTTISATVLSPKDDFVSVSFRGSLCRRDDLRSMCVDYSRMPQPTALGGVRNTDLVGLIFNERLSARDSLSLGANYSRSSEAATTVLAIPTTEHVSARASVDRRFSQRVSGFISGSVAKIYRSGLSVDPSISIGAGITVHLGQRR